MNGDAMKCVSPDVIRQKVSFGATQAEITLRHCENGYIYLDVEFSPTRLGAKVAVQGYVHVEGQIGPQTATSKVTFHDDGQVSGYGDLSNGVRFAQKKWILENKHRAMLGWSIR
jgi:hypothetical protein